MVVTNCTSSGVSKKTTWVWICVCVSKAAMIFPPPFSEIESKGFISYSFPPIRSDTLNLYSCVFHWTGTSPATWSEGNKSSELHQALCHSMQWGRLPGPAMVMPWEERSYPSRFLSQWIFLPRPKMFRPVYMEVWATCYLRACAFAGSLSPLCPRLSVTLDWRNRCWAPPAVGATSQVLQWHLVAQHSSSFLVTFMFASLRQACLGTLLFPQKISSLDLRVH